MVELDQAYIIHLSHQQREFSHYTLNPKPKSIVIKGYEHSPTKLARIEIDKIFMAFFLIQKGNGNNDKVDVKINLAL